jgi:hypothetical protein
MQKDTNGNIETVFNLGRHIFTKAAPSPEHMPASALFIFDYFLIVWVRLTRDGLNSTVLDTFPSGLLGDGHLEPSVLCQFTPFMAVQDHSPSHMEPM